MGRSICMQMVVEMDAGMQMMCDDGCSTVGD